MLESVLSFEPACGGLRAYPKTGTGILRHGACPGFRIGYKFSITRAAKSRPCKSARCSVRQLEIIPGGRRGCFEGQRRPPDRVLDGESSGMQGDAGRPGAGTALFSVAEDRVAALG